MGAGQRFDFDHGCFTVDAGCGRGRGAAGFGPNVTSRSVVAAAGSVVAVATRPSVDVTTILAG